GATGRTVTCLRSVHLSRPRRYLADRAVSTVVNGSHTRGAVDMAVRAVIERQYLTTAEVAELFRTTAETVRYWRWAGKGPRSIKVGRRVLYDVGDVEAYRAALRDAGPDAA